jgi:hypothetical protein
MTLTAIIPGSPRARNSRLTWAAFALFFLATPACVFAQSSPQIVGSIEGEDFAVDSAGGGTTQAIQAVNGQLASGARVTVKSGQARVIFNAGGAIAICGAARFQLLASGGTLTLVLEYGEIDLHLDADSAVKIFTPLIVATPISIGGGTRETIVGLARSGDMCLHTPHGAARVEQQLSGESLLVPQFGEVSLAGGQLMALKSPNGTCACEVDEARLIKPKVPAVQPAPTVVTKETIGALATPETKRPSAPVAPKPAATPAEQPPPPLAISAPSAPLVAAQEVPPAPEQPRPSGPPVQPPVAPAVNSQARQQLPDTDGPIYKVLVPALTFDALSPAPPPGPNPETIILVRSVRVQQDTIYTDKVESKGGTKTAAAKQQSPNSGESKPPSHGFFASVGRFFHRIFS